MLGVAGILGQEIVRPEQWWYTAGLPENLPKLDGNDPNMGEGAATATACLWYLLPFFSLPCWKCFAAQRLDIATE
jgi:hypothetical protein